MTPRLPLLAIALLISACSPRRLPPPLSWEFGQDRYLTSEFLTTTRGSRCSKSPGRIEVIGSLPDSTYFAVRAADSPYPEPQVAFERGFYREGERNRRSVAVILNPNAGIVTGFDRGAQRAFGIRTYEARWLSELGRRALALDCTAASDETR